MENKIDLAPSASRCTINLQDHETSCAAYRLEFQRKKSEIEWFQCVNDFLLGLNGHISLQEKYHCESHILIVCQDIIHFFILLFHHLKQFCFLRACNIAHELVITKKSMCFPHAPPKPLSQKEILLKRLSINRFLTHPRQRYCEVQEK